MGDLICMLVVASPLLGLVVGFVLGLIGVLDDEPGI